MASGRHTIDPLNERLNECKSQIYRSLARLFPEIDFQIPSETQITAALRSVVSDPSPEELQASRMYWGAAGNGLNYTRSMLLGKTSIDPKYPRVIEAMGAISLALLDVVPELANAVRRGPQTSRLPSYEQVEAAMRRALPDPNCDEMSACQRYWGPGGRGLATARTRGRRSR
jgi:hypothetical protein